MQQTFPAGEAQRLSISDIKGDVTVRGWDQQTIQIESNAEIERLQPAGGTFAIHDGHGAVSLQVPFEIQVTARDVGGTVTLENVRRADLSDIHNVVVSGISGEVIVKDVRNGVVVHEARDIVRISDVRAGVAVDGAARV